MSRITPLTVRAVTAHSEGRRMVAAAFAADGRIDQHEQAALDALDEAGRLLNIADLARRTGDWVRDMGALPRAVDISPYLMREWRELNADGPLDAA